MSAAASTIVFADLTGSTSAYQKGDNAQVASAVGQITRWIAQVFDAHEGRGIKLLGDGVMAQVSTPERAITAATFLLRTYSEKLAQWPEFARLPMRIGMAHGAIVAQDDADALGETVNLAARLCDMAGPHSIWADASVILHLRESGNQQLPHYRSLGMIRVRGLDKPAQVFQIEWNESQSTDGLTLQAILPPGEPPAAPRLSMALACLGHSAIFPMHKVPIYIGRTSENDFVVSDPRVSRTHARIDYADGFFTLTDTSSFGTWVRFSGSQEQVISLRRNHCGLHSNGEIALGAPFTNLSAISIAFHISSELP